MEIFPDFNGNYSMIVNILFFGLIFIQLFWVLFFYLRIAIYKDKKNIATPPVSVIIAAKNEVDNLLKFLPNILEQDYPEFEVIVINHQSKDGTIYVLKDLEKIYPHLRTIDLQKSGQTFHGKKLPITLGVKGAKYEHLLFTDADCLPISKDWIRDMAGRFTEKKEIVLGYAPYNQTDGFLNRIIRLDTTFIALNYLSFAKAGVPYMGVGRNLAYTKDLFLTNGGFKSHYAILSGDDDLFIQEVAKNKNYTVSLSPSTFCYSDPENTWTNWRNQKARHFTTSSRYPLFKKLLLGIYPLSLILLCISFVILIVNNWMNWTTLGAIFVLAITKWIILGMAFKKLKQKSLGWGILLWDLFYAFFAPINYYTSAKSNKATWK